jgi:hypothetical protein
MAEILDDTELAMACRLACKQLERIVADVRTLKGTGQALLVTSTEAVAGDLYRLLRRLGGEVESASTLDQVNMTCRRVDKLDDQVIRAVAQHRMEVIRRSSRTSCRTKSAP